MSAQQDTVNIYQDIAVHNAMLAQQQPIQLGRQTGYAYGGYGFLQQYAQHEHNRLIQLEMALKEDQIYIPLKYGQSIKDLLTNKYHMDRNGRSKKAGVPSYVNILIEKYTEEIKDSKNKIKLTNLLMNKTEIITDSGLFRKFINNWDKPYHIWLWDI